MTAAKEPQIAARALSGYVGGSTAAAVATHRALEKLTGARAVILVEGISDQIALETTARMTDRDLTGDGVVVLPIGGAHGVGRFLEILGVRGCGLSLAGLCDLGEEWIYRRALQRTGYGAVIDRSGMEATGFFVCEDDLEDELIRAAGVECTLDVFASHGDLRSFQTLQTQAVWQDRPIEAQIRRFLGAGARRKLRYAHLLTEALEVQRIPDPLRRCLAAV